MCMQDVRIMYVLKKLVFRVSRFIWFHVRILAKCKKLVFQLSGNQFFKETNFIDKELVNQKKELQTNL